MPVYCTIFDLRTFGYDLRTFGYAFRSKSTLKNRLKIKWDEGEGVDCIYNKRHNDERIALLAEIYIPFTKVRIDIEASKAFC